MEDSSFERVGESIPLAVDVRVIAATNVHIGDSLAAGKLRADLFYRLSHCTIEIPPLRERVEDIPPLVTLLSAQIAAALGLPRVRFTPALMKPLNAYEWPGNVRELRKIVSRLVIFHSMRNQLSAATVEGMLEESRALLAQAAKPSRPTGQATRDPERADQGRRESGRAEQVGTERARREPARTEPGGPEGFQAVPLEEVERRHILDTLESTGGIISGPFGAAAVLGLPRSTLQHRMRKLGIGRRRRTGAEV